MKFNFKNKEVLPKALRDSLKNDDVTETDEVGASNPPGAARRSRRTDVIPKDVDISHPPFNVSKFLVKNHKDFDVLDTGEAKRRGLRFCSPLAQELRKFKVPDISDEEIIRMIRSGDRTGNFLLLCKHYKYILKKIGDITQRNWYSDDILQAGAVGLYEAAIRFDETRKVKFLTYAHSWIVKMVYIEIRNELLPMAGMGIGRDAKERLFNYIKYSMFGLTDEEIMEKLHISHKVLVELQILNRAVSRIKSLNQTSNDDEDDLEPYNEKGVPTKPSAEAEFLTQEFFEYLENCIKTLGETDAGLAEFLNMELGLNGSHQMEKAEICNKMQLTSKEYEQLKQTGNRYLRTQMIEDGWYDRNASDLVEAVDRCAKKIETQHPNT